MVFLNTDTTRFYCYFCFAVLYCYCRTDWTEEATEWVTDRRIRRIHLTEFFFMGLSGTVCEEWLNTMTMNILYQGLLICLINWRDWEYFINWTEVGVILATNNGRRHTEDGFPGSSTGIMSIRLYHFVIGCIDSLYEWTEFSDYIWIHL